MLQQIENNTEQTKDFDYPFAWDETKYLDTHNFSKEQDVFEGSRLNKEAIATHSFLRI